LRFDFIYAWPGFGRYATFNMGFRPVRAELTGHKDFGAQAPNIEVYAQTADALLTYASLTETSRVVEIGSGLGGGLAYLRARLPGQQIGIDQSLTATLRARLTGLTAQRASALALPFDAGSLDAIIAVEAIFLYGDADGCLAEVCRTLKPGGILALAEFGGGKADRFRRVIENAARHHGLQLVSLIDCTPSARQQVIDGEPQRQVTYRRLPWFLRETFFETLTVLNSRRYKRWVDGKECYVIAVFARDPDAVDRAVPAKAP
jgi:SAM-dependent methyltransferase